MADREGLWDCPACGFEGIPGLKTVCPNCRKVEERSSFIFPIMRVF